MLVSKTLALPCIDRQINKIVTLVFKVLWWRIMHSPGDFSQLSSLMLCQNYFYPFYLQESYSISRWGTWTWFSPFRYHLPWSRLLYYQCSQVVLLSKRGSTHVCQERVTGPDQTIDCLTWVWIRIQLRIYLVRYCVQKYL